FYLRPRPYRPGGEIADENILQSPDDLTDPIWDVNSLDVALVDDNPIGEIEEYFSLIEKAEEDDHYIQQQVDDTPANRLFEFSATIYGAGRDFALLLVDPDSLFVGARFNSTNGSLIRQVVNGPDWFAQEQAIVALGDGWSRYTIRAYNMNPQAFILFKIVLIDADENSFYEGDGTSGIYIKDILAKIGEEYVEE